MAISTSGNRVVGLALLVLIVIWGFNFTIMKVATHDSGPFTFSAQRYVLGTLVFSRFLRFDGANSRRLPGC